MFERFYSKNRVIRSMAISTISVCILFLFAVFNGIERQHRVEAPIIFSMQDLGYSNSEVVSAKLKESRIKESGNSVLSYNLFLKSSDEDNDPVILEFTVHLCSEKDAMEVFKNSIIAIKESERPHCKTKCYYLPIVYEDAIKEMFQLNPYIWEIDLGYSQIDYSTTSSWGKHVYQMVLLNDNKVMSVKIDKNISLSNEVIKSIVSIFERVEELRGEK